MSKTMMAMIVVVALSGVAALMEVRVRRSSAAPAPPREAAVPRIDGPTDAPPPAVSPARRPRAAVLIG